MNTKKARTGRVGGTPVTAQGLERLANDFLGAFSKRLLEVAAKMNSMNAPGSKKKVETIEVQHWGTASRGLEAIAKFVADAERALSVHTTASVKDLFPGDNQSNH